MGEFFPDLNFGRGAGNRQRLFIRVYRDKVNALGTGSHHAVDDVASRAAHADHPDIDDRFGTCIQSKCHIVLPPAIRCKSGASAAGKRFFCLIYCMTLFPSGQALFSRF